MRTRSVGHCLYTASDVFTEVYPTSRTSMVHFHGNASVPAGSVRQSESTRVGFSGKGVGFRV